MRIKEIIDLVKKLHDVASDESHLWLDVAIEITPNERIWLIKLCNPIYHDMSFEDFCKILPPLPKDTRIQKLQDGRIVVWKRVVL